MNFLTRAVVAGSLVFLVDWPSAAPAAGKPQVVPFPRAVASNAAKERWVYEQAVFWLQRREDTQYDYDLEIQQLRTLPSGTRVYVAPTVDFFDKKKLLGIFMDLKSDPLSYHSTPHGMRVYKHGKLAATYAKVVRVVTSPSGFYLYLRPGQLIPARISDFILVGTKP